jgi:hypothetical protein
MELGVVERAIHGAAAITGRLWVKPEPLAERRRHVNMLEICIGFGPLWKAVESESPRFEGSVWGIEEIYHVTDEGVDSPLLVLFFGLLRSKGCRITARESFKALLCSASISSV